MPPIKRTKFKLSHDQLLEMFYWLKLIRALRRAPQHARQAGQGPQRRLHRHRPGSDHRRHLFRPAQGRLRLPAAPRPGLVPHEGRDRADDDGADVREGDRPVEGPRFGAPQRRHRAGHLRQHQHARRAISRSPPASALTFKMENVDNVVIAYFGEGASNTGDFHEALNIAGVQRLPILFICENNQYAYSVPLEKSMAIDDVADPRGRLRLRRRRHQRQRRAGGLSGDAGRARARAQQAKARRSSNARPIAGTATPSTTRRSIARTKSWRCGRAAIRFRPSRPT